MDLTNLQALTDNEVDYLDLVMGCHMTMEKYNMTLAYEGEVNQSITKAFTSLAEKNLNDEQEDKSTIRKVYHVMVECLQNIYKHSDDFERGGKEKKNHGIFIVGHDGKGYIVATGNMVSNDKVERLKNALDHINAQDQESLKEMYKKQIRTGELSEKGGAGLGFIDISKKTGHPIDYKFQNVDQNKSFFILKTYIAK